MLINSCKWGNLRAVKECVEYFGDDVSAESDEAIKTACTHGHLNIVKYLTGKGANITTYFNSPIRWASNYGYLKIVKYLVSKGADITDCSNWATKWAENNEQFEIVEYATELVLNEMKKYTMLSLLNRKRVINKDLLNILIVKFVKYSENYEYYQKK